MEKKQFKFLCPVCGYVNVYTYDLKDMHLFGITDIYDVDTKHYSCPDCSVVFSDPFKFTSHAND